MAVGALAPSTAAADETFARLGKKYTLINATAAGVVSQPLTGYWWWKPRSRRSGTPRHRPILYRFSVLHRTWLLLHSGDSARIDPSIRPGKRHLLGEGVPGVLGQFRHNGGCFTGLIRTVEVRYPGKRPDCPQYYWWTLTRACIDKRRLKGSLQSAGYHHDPKTCQKDQRKPLSLAADMERFVGAAFAPIQRGKYIGVGIAVAPARYKAAVKLAWDYRTFAKQGRTAAGTVVVSLGAQTSGSKYTVLRTAAPSGAHVFNVQNGGRYHFVFKVYDTKGGLIHWDQLLAEIPRI